MALITNKVDFKIKTIQRLLKPKIVHQLRALPQVPSPWSFDIQLLPLYMQTLQFIRCIQNRRGGSYLCNAVNRLMINPWTPKVKHQAVD
jgi:hypothetical protein